MEIRTEMTLAEALAMYPQLNKQMVKLVAYPNDSYYPSWAVFEFKGDNNSRTEQIPKV